MSKKNNVSLTRDAAIAIFVALGITTAAKWNAARMAKKLSKLDEVVDEDTEIEDDAVQADVEAVLAAIEAEAEITVAAPAKKKAAAKTKTPAKTKKDKPTPAKKKAAAKTKKDKPTPAADKKMPGVRETRTRPFLAGCIIKEQGLKSGVTNEMADELDERYGKENSAESLFCLRNAWHAIRGFQKGDKDKD